MARTTTPIALLLKSLTTLIDIFSSPAPTAGQVLTATSSTAATWQTPIGSPAGSTTQVQFNDAGAFGASSKLTFDKTNGIVAVTPAGTGTALTNPIIQTTGSIDNFTQISIQNKSATANSSSDHIAYPDNNTNDTTGFVDIGITSSTFAQAAYAITTPNDAYLFGSAVSGAGKLGNLVIATDSTGSSNSIIFGTNGFSALSKEKARIDGSTGIFSFGYSAVTNANLKLYNSTNSNTVSIQSGITTTSYTLTLPVAVASAGQVLRDTAGNGVLSWATPGDVIGPAGSTDNYMPIFSGTTGKLLKQGSQYVFNGFFKSPNIQAESTGNNALVTYGGLTFASTAKGIYDATSTQISSFTTIASSVNYYDIGNNTTTNAPTISAKGSDTNIDVNLVTKGTGILKVNGISIYAKPLLNAYYEALTTDTDGATVTFDMSASNIHTVVLGGNRTLAVSNVSVGQKFRLRLVQDATGTRTVTWFATIKWPTGVPTLTVTANKTDVVELLCTSAGNYDGQIIGQNL